MASAEPHSEHFPSTIWLCPLHYGEFYMPHGGRCPQPGCDENLIAFPRQGARAEEALADACLVLTDPERTDRRARNAAVQIIESALDDLEGAA